MILYRRITCFTALFDCSLKRSSRVRIVLSRNFSYESWKMSTKTLPKWRKPEGDSELRIYNSLTKEKVCNMGCYFSNRVTDLPNDFLELVVVQL